MLRHGPVLPLILRENDTETSEGPGVPGPFLLAQTAIAFFAAWARKPERVNPSRSA